MLKLASANAISIRIITPGTDDVTPISELVVDGRPTGLHLEGALLEAAIHCDAGLLLLMTDDYSFEDGLHIYLVDPGFVLLDSASMGWAYADALFSDLRLQPPDTVLFRFLGPVEWSVRILPERTWRMPLFSEPLGVSRTFGFVRRFIVQAKTPARDG